MLTTIINTCKTVVIKFNLRYYCWVVRNLQSDLFELETIKKSSHKFSSIEQKHLALEIMDTQRELVQMKKKVKELEEQL